MMNTGRGFTLVELLVAMAIFAVIAALSVRALSASIDQRAGIEDDARKWRELGRVLTVIESDLASALASASAPFVGHATPGESGGIWLEFARAGRSVEDETPSPPRGIVYRIRGTTLERASFHALANASAADSLAVQRFPSVIRAIALRYLNASGDWRTEWRDAQGELPRALELTLELAGGERVRRIMLIR
jgi:general secretion pathway protein J